MKIHFKRWLKEYAFSLLLIFLILLFNDTFEYWITSFLKSNTKFYQTDWDDNLILLLLIFLASTVVSFIYIRHFSNKIKSITHTPRIVKTTFWIIAWTIFYNFNRTGITVDNEIYTPEYLWNCITIFDLFAYLPFTHLVVATIITKQKIKTNISELINDIPIKESKSDEFYRTNLAKKLALQIKNFYDREYSFVIGIESEWGNGKSSFLRILKNNLLNEEKIIIINFNAWQYTSDDKLTLSFLTELRSKLITETGINDYHIRKIIRKIFSENGFLRSIKEFFNPSDIESLKSDLCHDIIISNVKIVVFIDDLDRLQKDELLETLNIVRNVGNIGNMIFVLAYDKEYILGILNEDKKNEADYFSKFVQVEISLGKIPQNNIVIYFEGELKKLFPKQIEAYEYSVTSAQSSKVDDPSISKKDFKNIEGLELIRNKRDAIKVINYLSIQYELLQESLIFIEFLQLAIIKMRFSFIYNEIRNQNIFIQDFHKYTFSIDEEKVEKLIAELQENDKKSVKYLLFTLFPNNDDSRPQYSVSNKNAIDAYFKNELYGELNIAYLNSLFNEI